MTRSFRQPQRAILVALLGPENVPVRIRELMESPVRTKELRHQISHARGQGDASRARCACCKAPVYIAMARSGEARQPYFAHFSRHGEDCPWITGQPEDPRAIRARQYQGQQKSLRHDQLTWALSEALRADPSVAEVAVERYCRPRSSTRHGRFPDVYAERSDGRRYAFEIQLSTTQMTEISERRAFYLAEDIQLFWVMDARAESLDHEAFRDVIHEHSHDVFLVDETVAAAAKREGQLRLKRKAFRDGAFEERPDVGLDDMIFTGRALPFVEDGVSAVLLAEARERRRSLFAWLDLHRPVRSSWKAADGLPLPEASQDGWGRLSLEQQATVASLVALVATCCLAAKSGHLVGEDFENYDTREVNLSAALNSWCSSQDRAPLVRYLATTIEVLGLHGQLKPSSHSLLEATSSAKSLMTPVAATVLAYFFAEIHDQIVHEALTARALPG